MSKLKIIVYDPAEEYYPYSAVLEDQQWYETIDQMNEWLVGVGIPYTCVGNQFWFKDEQNLTMFMLRWS